MVKYIIPLLLFSILSIFLAVGLNLKPNEIPSPLINTQAPEFSAAQLQDPLQKLSPTDLRGQVWLLNVWASWCSSCREEHKVLNHLAQQKIAVIIGLNYKDSDEGANNWLNTLGNPYTTTIVDPEGRIGLDWGVYGVPETFIIDKKGIVRHKLTGPVTADSIQQILLPLIKQLQAE